MNKQTITKIIAEFCRILLGITFIFSGTVKGIDPMGTAIKTGDYLAVFGLNHSTWIDIILSFNLIAIELTLGVCVLLGAYRKLSTLGLLLFMCIMTPLTLYLALYNPVPDCGCFGDAVVITNWQTFFKNVVLLTAAIIAFIYCKRLTPLYSYRAYWFVALFSYLFCIGFCYWNYNHLPIMDFRSYKVGANIPKLMEIPADAPQDEYLFVYEKDGVQKEFKLEEAPAGDSTWVYVDAKLIKPGFIPEVSSFEFYNEQGDNVAEEIFQQTQPVFLLIADKLDEASDKHIDEINNIYDYAKENQMSFYGVTSSSEHDIEDWQKNTGADYPFLTADDVLLKTIVRSNPGLVLLNHGTILGKWHHNDIPNENELKSIVNGYLSDGGIMNQTKKGHWNYIIIAFVLPLLLIWIYDFFHNRKYRETTDISQTTK